MAYGDPNDFGWCNLVVKFLLFVTNVIVWVSSSYCCNLILHTARALAIPLLSSFVHTIRVLLSYSS